MLGLEKGSINDFLQKHMYYITYINCILIHRFIILDDCLVPVVHNGDIKRETMGNFYWNWKSFRYDREVQHIRVMNFTYV